MSRFRQTLIITAIAFLFPFSGAKAQSLDFSELALRIMNPRPLNLTPMEFKNPAPFNVDLPYSLDFGEETSKQEFGSNITGKPNEPLRFGEIEYEPPHLVKASQYLSDPYGHTRLSATGHSLWPGGFIAATASTESLPGLMGIEQGGLFVGQRMSNVTLTGGVIARKMGWYRGLHTSYLFSGNLDWTINETFSLHFFGSYRPGSYDWFYNSPTTTPAMMGYMGTTNFGGYMSINFSDRFGVDLGAQTYYNMATGKYEVQPIGRPYYRINKDVKIGVDVGGILYQLLRSASGNDRVTNPTIRPPVGMGSMQVNPRH